MLLYFFSVCIIIPIDTRIVYPFSSYYHIRGRVYPTYHTYVLRAPFFAVRRVWTTLSVVSCWMIDTSVQSFFFCAKRRSVPFATGRVVGVVGIVDCHISSSPKSSPSDLIPIYRRVVNNQAQIANCPPASSPQRVPTPACVTSDRPQSAVV